VGNPTDEDIATADSELALAQAQYDAAKAILESLEIKAPFDGIVFEVSAQSGQTYQAEATIFIIGDPKALEVIANVTEEDYPLLAIGQSVEVYFDARPEVTVTGKVERIIPKRIEGDRPLYNIYISLNEIPDGLADGMTSDTAITIAKHEGVLCLPRAIVRASGGDTTTVKVWNGLEEATKEITIGLRGDTYVEVISGLSEGEQVVTR
jgi:RND family efflux transporter MFP subunit